MNRIYQGKGMNRLSAIKHWSFANGAGDWSLIINDSATPPVIDYFASVIRRSRWTQ